MKREFDTRKKEYTLSILVQDIPGVLSQVARLFSRKGYNIESIVSGETDKPHVTRITIVLVADELMINQIADQCRKLIPVLAVKIWTRPPPSSGNSPSSRSMPPTATPGMR